MMTASAPTIQTHLLQTADLGKTFTIGETEQVVLKNLDLAIAEGEFVVIMGASGSGKSTLLYALSGMDSPTSGRIFFNDCEISESNGDKLAIFRRKNCGFVFQQVYLLDNMSLMDNAMASGRLAGEGKREVARHANELFDRVDISQQTRHKFPNQVSGGEAQRAAMVRALINRPTVLFADEPTGALNTASGTAVLDVLTQAHVDRQTIVMVTHDLNSALRGSRILYLQDGSICGECHLGTFTPESDQDTNAPRREKLRSFLVEMGW
jgi:putative ABC transport system ATP-binding protein